MRHSLSRHQKSKHRIDAIPSERHKENVAIVVPSTRCDDLLEKEFSKQRSEIQPDSVRHGRVTSRQSCIFEQGVVDGLFKHA